MTPVLPLYRCASCGAIWTYAAVRHVARCKHGQAGLVRAGTVTVAPGDDGAARGEGRALASL